MFYNAFIVDDAVDDDDAAAVAAAVTADINRLIEFQSGLPGCINNAAVDS